MIVRIAYRSLAAILVAGCVTRSGAAEGDVASQREDLVAFRSQFFAVDRSYAPAARSEAERRLRELESHPGAISNARFVLALSQIVALADNGHTVMGYRGDGAAFRRVGIRLAPFGDQFYVVRAIDDQATLLGGRLVAVDGNPIAVLRDSARTLVGGTAAWRDRRAPDFLESPGQLHALGLARSATSARYRFEMSAGGPVEATLAIAPETPSDRIGSIGALDPEASPGWRSVAPAGRTPWAMQDFAEFFRRRDAPELDAVVIQLRANYNAGNQGIAAFLESSDSLRRALGRRNVVLDMRFNGGGDLQTTRAFMSDLPRRVGAAGHVYVLTSPWTFSAAISSTAYVKQASVNNVTLIGEAPGDRLQFWAEGRPVELPRSGAYVQYATQRHDYVTGCRPFTDCHDYMVRFPIAVKSVAPDIAAPWTIESYAAGRDPAMEAVAQAVNAARRN